MGLNRKSAAKLASLSALGAGAATARASASARAAQETAAPFEFERWSAPAADRSRTVTIVAGLPRSGTSMMMQMLAAAGIEPYTDRKREPDEDNPRGYFEHEHATRLHRDASWIPEARGKVVKVVATLLPHLPLGEDYRIIFMMRNLDEVIASQGAMLARLQRDGGRLTGDDLRGAFSGHLVRVQQWLQSRPAIAVLPIDYAATITDPAATATRLAHFLGAPFDTASAASSVAPHLRHQHS